MTCTVLSVVGSIVSRFLKLNIKAFKGNDIVDALAKCECGRLYKRK